MMKWNRGIGRILNRDYLGVLFLACCFAMALVAAVPVGRSGSFAANAVWVEPSPVGVDFTVGNKFNVTLWTNLSVSSFVWEIGLRFNRIYLNAVRAGYTADGRSDFFSGHSTVPVTPIIDNATGIVHYCETLMGSDFRAAGSGSLCWIEFQVVAKTSNTTLSLDAVDTYVLDPDLNDVYDLGRLGATVVDVGQGGDHRANALWVDPPITNISFTIGTRFNVTVWANISQPSYVWCILLRFDAIYLNAVRAGYTAAGKSDFFSGHNTIPTTPIFDKVAGSVIHGESLMGSDFRAAGSGSLCWIEFQVVNPTGETTVYLDGIDMDTFVLDPDLNVIPAITLYSAVILNGLQPFLPMVFVCPVVSTVGLSVPFSVCVNVSRVSDLYNWEFKLYYQRDLLNFTGVLEGTFLRSGGSTVWADASDPAYNGTHGMVYVGASLLGLVPGVNGNGTLAVVSFQALLDANSTLCLSDVSLLDSELYEIACESVGGSVVIGRENLAVVAVAANKDVVGQNCVLNVTVTVQNQGFSIQSFGVTLYANMSVMSVQLVTGLVPNGSLSFVCVWNASSFAVGNYTLSGVADVVGGEANVMDNTLVNGTLRVRIIGDINGDNKVDMKDIGSVCRIFGVVQGNPLFNANCDINNDGRIDMKDIGIACRNFGHHYP